MVGIMMYTQRSITSYRPLVHVMAFKISGSGSWQLDCVVLGNYVYTFINSISKSFSHFV